MYYIECPINRSDSIGIFLDLIKRGHLRFYGTDTKDPKIVVFRICLPEALRYGLSNDMISSSYPIYDQNNACYIKTDLFLRRDLSVVNPTLVLVTDPATIMWDTDLEKFKARSLINHRYDSHKRREFGPVLRNLGFPQDFFIEYFDIFYQTEDEKYIFKKTSDIWK